MLGDEVSMNIQEEKSACYFRVQGNMLSKPTTSTPGQLLLAFIIIIMAEVNVPFPDSQFSSERLVIPRLFKNKYLPSSCSLHSALYPISG